MSYAILTHFPDNVFFYFCYVMSIDVKKLQMRIYHYMKKFLRIFFRSFPCFLLYFILPSNVLEIFWQLLSEKLIEGKCCKKSYEH